MVSRTAWVLLLVATMMACGSSPPRGERACCAYDEPTPLAVGQEWTFYQHTGARDAYACIGRLEDDPRFGQIVHVSVRGSVTIGHMPFTVEAIGLHNEYGHPDCVPDPAFEEGYATWKVAADAGKGGVFTIPIHEAIEAVTGRKP